MRQAATAGIVAVAGGDGTLNHFARRLGIDSPEAAARAVAGGRVVWLPVGSVNGRIFINNVSVGVYPRFVRTRERLRPKIGRPLAIAAATLHTLWRLRQVTIGIEACGISRDRAIEGRWIGLGRGSCRLPGDAGPIAARNLEMVLAPGHNRLRLVLEAVRERRRHSGAATRRIRAGSRCSTGPSSR